MRQCSDPQCNQPFTAEVKRGPSYIWIFTGLNSSFYFLAIFFNAMTLLGFLLASISIWRLCFLPKLCFHAPSLNIPLKDGHSAAISLQNVHSFLTVSQCANLNGSVEELKNPLVFNPILPLTEIPVWDYNRACIFWLPPSPITNGHAGVCGDIPEKPWKFQRDCKNKEE